MKLREVGRFEVRADERGAFWAGWSEGSKDETRFAPGEELILFPGCDSWPIGSVVIGSVPNRAALAATDHICHACDGDSITDPPCPICGGTGIDTRPKP